MDIIATYRKASSGYIDEILTIRLCRFSPRRCFEIVYCQNCYFTEVYSQKCLPRVFETREIIYDRIKGDWFVCSVMLIILPALAPRFELSELRDICEGAILIPLRKIENGGLGRKSSSSSEATELLQEIGEWPLLMSLEAEKDLVSNSQTAITGYNRSDWINQMSVEGDMWAECVLDEAKSVHRDLATNSILTKISDRIFPPFVDSETKSSKLIDTYVKSGLASTPDSLCHLRIENRDTVYVIDSSTANELDDGLSADLEDQSNPQDPSSYWLNVHIADPTAYLDSHNPIALMAQIHGNSAYFPHIYHPMIPEVLSNRVFNLKSGAKALTFSAKFDSSGEIVDYKVEASVLKDVRVVQYDNVDKVLDWSNIHGVGVADASNLSPWTKIQLSKVPGPSSTTTPPSGLSQQCTSKLRAIQSMTTLHTNYRLRNDLIIQDNVESSVHVTPFPLKISGKSEPSSTIFLNSCKTPSMSPSHNMVGEAMIIAGRVAAKFCIDHKVPILYRGQASIRDMPCNSESLRTLDSVLGARDARSGVVDYFQHQELIKYLPAAVHDHRPIKHASMGIPGIDPLELSGVALPDTMIGYVKVTSPLRRYKDMLAHWHIKTALLKTNRFAFSLAQLEVMAPLFVEKEKKARRVSNSWSRFWILEWSRRRQLLTEDMGRDPLAAGYDSNGVILHDEALGVGILDNNSMMRRDLNFKCEIQPVYNCFVTAVDHGNRRMTTALVIELGITVGLNTGKSNVSRGSIVKCVIGRVSPTLGQIEMVLRE